MAIDLMEESFLTKEDCIKLFKEHYTQLWFKSKSQLWWVLSKNIEKELQREEEFFSFFKKKIDVAYNIRNKENKLLVIYFDLDETIVAYWENTLRPWAELLFQELKKMYKDSLILWILSSRWIEHINEFAKKYKSFFDSQHCIWSREINVSPEDEKDIIKNGRWKWSEWHFQKVKAFMQIQQKKSSTYNILIDDIIEDSFEKKQLWFRVPQKLYANLELEKHY